MTILAQLDYHTTSQLTVAVRLRPRVSCDVSEDSICFISCFFGC